MRLRKEKIASRKTIGAGFQLLSSGAENLKKGADVFAPLTRPTGLVKRESAAVYDGAHFQSELISKPIVTGPVGAPLISTWSL